MYGAPEGIRTPDRSVRSRVLYPAELQAHNLSLWLQGAQLSRFIATTSIYMAEKEGLFRAILPSTPRAPYGREKSFLTIFSNKDSYQVRLIPNLFKSTPDKTLLHF